MRGGESPDFSITRMNTNDGEAGSCPYLENVVGFSEEGRQRQMVVAVGRAGEVY